MRIAFREMDTTTRRIRREWMLVLSLLVMTLQATLVGCEPAKKAAVAASLDRASCGFPIYWPPKDPHDDPPPATKPLLHGTLGVDTNQDDGNRTEIRLTVTLTRPSDERDRQFWNSELAFADISWMGEVRVWDAEKQWLWPNLPYLLRLFGRERVQRYGGMDPGKHVDNDFAAVLIRKYDVEGKIESPDTKDAPLVSAEWHPEGAGETNLHSIVHTARSDVFRLHVGGGEQPARGRIKVWLIYADFLRASPPRTWPKAREWAGGILAYFEIDWETSPGDVCRGAVHARRPEEGTGFPWAQWVVRKPGSSESEAEIRLSDRTE